MEETPYILLTMAIYSERCLRGTIRSPIEKDLELISTASTPATARPKVAAPHQSVICHPKSRGDLRKCSCYHSYLYQRSGPGQ